MGGDGKGKGLDESERDYLASTIPLMKAATAKWI
jgi:hypothetical protein